MIRKALVVGINTYNHNHFRKLKAAATDADAIAQRLRQDGEFKVTYLPEALLKEGDRLTPSIGETLAVPQAQLEAALKQLFQPASDQYPDTALFYFSGHGLPDPEGYDKGYLATSDTDPNRPKLAISLRWLHWLLSESPIPNQIVWLDCCNSGGLLIDVQAANPGHTNGRSRCFIASSRDFEKSWQDLNSPYSVLTKALLDGLAPTRLPERWVDTYALVDYVNQALKDEQQTPTCTNFGDAINLTRTWKFETTTARVDRLESSDDYPYQGLKAFTRDTSHLFYGRKATVDSLKKRLDFCNLVPVIGLSGSGKSSVVRAGLIPELEEDDWYVLEPIQPDEEPMAALRQAMRDLFKRPADRKEVTALLNEQGLLPVLEKIINLSLLGKKFHKALLVIDQFEEVFTICSQELERKKFISCINEVQRLENSPLAIVITVRADFLGECLKYSTLVPAIRDQAVWLERLDGKDLIEAIQQPAIDKGYEFESGLLQLILDDVEVENECLPLMEFALTELWQMRDVKRRILTLNAYQQMQRLGGALDKRAEYVYENELTNDQERDWARRVCLELVRIGQDAKDTRQRQPRKVLEAMGAQADCKTIGEVIDVLALGRLLVLTETGEVDLAHEALMTEWKRFARWRQSDKELRLLAQRTKDSEKEWKNKDEDERYLLPDGLLSEVQAEWKTLEKYFGHSTRAYYELSCIKQAENQHLKDQLLNRDLLTNQELEIPFLTEQFSQLKKTLESIFTKLQAPQNTKQEQMHEYDIYKEILEANIICLESEIRWTKKIYFHLDRRVEGRQLARIWLDQNADDLVQDLIDYVRLKFGNELEGIFKSEKSTSDASQLFEWDIQDYIEIIGHCIVVDRANLVSSISPNLMTIKPYLFAFTHLAKKVESFQELNRDACDVLERYIGSLIVHLGKLHY